MRTSVLNVHVSLIDNTTLSVKLIIFVEHDLRGGGGGGHPDYFVKLDFEIAVDQQTRARDRTFEGVPDSG